MRPWLATIYLELGTEARKAKLRAVPRRNRSNLGSNCCPVATPISRLQSGGQSAARASSSAPFSGMPTQTQGLEVKTALAGT